MQLGPDAVAEADRTEADPPAPGDRPAADPRHAHFAAHRGKLTLTSLANLDGRTVAAKRARQLIDEIQSDLDCDELSAKQMQYAQRAAFLGAMLENIEAKWLLGKRVDLIEYSTLANAQRRILEEL